MSIRQIIPIFARTIRVRLTLWYVALLAVILVAFSAFLYLNLARSLSAALNQSLAVDAQRTISGLDIQDGTPGFNEGIEESTGSSIVSLYDRRGRVLFSAAGRVPIGPSPGAFDQAVLGQPVYATMRGSDKVNWRLLAAPITENGEVVGVLEVARSESTMTAALGQLLILMAIAIPATLLLAVATGIFLAGRALNPIDQITRTAEVLGADDLSRRLHYDGIDDEVGRLATTFDRMLDRLDHAFQRQRTFTADASHELRTPLALLIGQADLALERSRTTSEYRQALSSMRDDAQRMHQLLGDLLTLARADAHQEELLREPLDLRELAQEVTTAMEPLAQSREVALQLGVTDSVTVVGDQTRMAQLLVNLIDNGLKYTPAGGFVILSVQRRGQNAVIQVQDSGVGIAAEHIPHLFERFYRVDKARSRAAGGTGLGLAISRWIVEIHGGTIAVTSQPERGSTFTVTLPRTPEKFDQRSTVPTGPLLTVRLRRPSQQ